MYEEQTGILAQPKKPGPVSRAAMSGIAAMPTDPDPVQAEPMPAALDPFAFRGGYPANAPAGPRNGPNSTALNPTRQGIAAPSQISTVPVLPGATRGISQLNPGERLSAALGAVDQGVDAVGKPEVKQAIVDHGVSHNNGIATMPTGRNDQGVITAESAQSAMGNPMTRSGGIAGSYDGKGVNDILARENAARGELIDASIRANGGNGVGILGGGAPTEAETINAERTNRWAINDLQDRMKYAGPRTERAAIGQALSQTIAGQNQQAIEAMRQQGAVEQRGIAAGVDMAKIAGVDQRAQDRNQVQMRGHEMTASTAADRMASSERIAAQRGEDAGRLTLPQRRSNFEIDAARKVVADLSPEDVKKRTANYTATGRENPDYDPNLAKAVSLAGRRMYGADDHFDQRQQPQHAGNDVDAVTRFRADKAMSGHRTGNVTEQGVEVLDASGKLIGHYR